MDDSEDIFEVERLLQESIREEGVFYLVKWKGYPIEEATWEPEENILDEDLLSDWKIRQSSILHSGPHQKSCYHCERSSGLLLACYSCSVSYHSSCWSDLQNCECCIKKIPICFYCTKSLENEDPVFSRCARCNDTFHFKCAKEEFNSLSEREFSCSYCSSLDYEIEKLLAFCVEKGKNYVHVKFKDQSHRKNQWVPEDWMKKVTKMMSPSRLDPDLKFTSMNDFKIPLIEIEKILSSSKNATITYFVKWKNQPYSASTIEQEFDLLEYQKKHQIHDFDIALEDYKKKMEDLKTISKPLRSSSFKELLVQPSCIHGNLHQYQLAGLNWLLYNWHQRRNSILADEMGLGKTIQTISFFNYLHEQYHIQPVLIIVPNSVCENWKREFQKWAPDLYISIYVGTPEDREIIRKYELSNPSLSTIQKEHRKTLFSNVIITSYALAIKDSKYLKKFCWGLIVVDEAHRLKGNESVLTFELSSYLADHRLLLTGTPFQNNLRELFNIMWFLNPEEFKSPQDLEKQYSDLEEENKIKELHDILRPYILRRTKSDLFGSQKLPPKKELILPVSMTTVQKTLYKSIIEKNCNLFLEKLVNQSKKPSLHNIMMELRKCTNHPFLVSSDLSKLSDSSRPDQLDLLVKSSGKMDLLDKLLKHLKETGHKVLIFSQFKIMLDIIEEYLELKEWNSVRIDGETPTETRQTLIDHFNKSLTVDSPFVFLLSTRAGGQGINLTAADTIILYDCDFNPHNDLQALSRAHRIGQEKPILVFRLVTRHSVEEKMMTIATKKLMLDHVVVGSLQDSIFEYTDIYDIIKFGVKDLFETTPDTTTFYHDDILDKLLDRSEMNTEASLEPLPNPSIFEGFNIANVWGKSTDQLEKPSDNDYWEKLLKEAIDKAIPYTVAEYGKGKRKKTKISYSNSLASEHDLDISDIYVHSDETSSEDLSNDTELETDVLVNNVNVPESIIENPSSHIGKKSNIEAIRTEDFVFSGFPGIYRFNPSVYGLPSVHIASINLAEKLKSTLNSDFSQFLSVISHYYQYLNSPDVSHALKKNTEQLSELVWLNAMDFVWIFIQKSEVYYYFLLINPISHLFSIVFLTREPFLPFVPIFTLCSSKQLFQYFFHDIKKPSLSTAAISPNRPVSSAPSSTMSYSQRSQLLSPDSSNRGLVFNFDAKTDHLPTLPKKDSIDKERVSELSMPVAVINKSTNTSFVNIGQGLGSTSLPVKLGSFLTSSKKDAVTVMRKNPSDVSISPTAQVANVAKTNRSIPKKVQETSFKFKCHWLYCPFATNVESLFVDHVKIHYSFDGSHQDFNAEFTKAKNPFACINLIQSRQIVLYQKWVGQLQSENLRLKRMIEALKSKK